MKREGFAKEKRAYAGEKRIFEKENYGIGLLNVEQIVEQKGGSLEITLGGGEFCVFILLPETLRKEMKEEREVQKQEQGNSRKCDVITKKESGKENL